MKTSIKGWNFFRFYSADGSTTVENLTTEKRRLEARLAELPGLISGLNNSISVLQNDVNWVKELDGLKKRRWENEKGVNAEEWVRTTETTLSKYRSQLESLNAEYARIPAQIEAVQKQLDTLIKGQSIGLEKGWDEQTAREMGQLELEKERAKIEAERQLKEAELQAQNKSREQAIENEQAQLQAQKTTKLFIGIGIGVFLLIIGIILYKKFSTKTAAI